MMPTFHDFPVELITEGLFPHCDLYDLSSLARTNKFLAEICNSLSSVFWRRRCMRDFHFVEPSDPDSSQIINWKGLYRGLHHPRIFVWGENSNGMLGLRKSDFRDHISMPIEVKIPGARIVSLASSVGSSSFHALDSDGSIYVWGTLSSQPPKVMWTPHKLLMPTPIRSVSCGDARSMALDTTGHIWIFLNWERPIRLLSSLLDCSTPEATPRQIECAEVPVILTQSGEVLVYPALHTTQTYVQSRMMYDAMDEYDRSEAASPELEDVRPARGACKRIACKPWDWHVDPIHLPCIPVLPALHDTGLTDEQLTEETKVVKIAGKTRVIYALTNKGHVLRYTLSGNMVSFTQIEWDQGSWEYLPYFSEAARLADHPAFSRPEPNKLRAPKKMLITNIIADMPGRNTWDFVAYSAGPDFLVLTMHEGSNVDEPEIIPCLQYRSVISIAHGSSHRAALTSSGSLSTWGCNYMGVLGHSWAQRGEGLEEPTEVEFRAHDRSGKKFCIAVTATRMQTAALVVDLEPDRPRPLRKSRARPAVEEPPGKKRPSEGVSRT